MRKLDSSGRAEAMQEVRDALHGTDLRIVPQSGTAVRDARVFAHCRRFDEDQPPPSQNVRGGLDESRQASLRRRCTCTSAKRRAGFSG